jgi:hypothetical protein
VQRVREKPGCGRRHFLEENHVRIAQLRDAARSSAARRVSRAYSMLNETMRSVWPDGVLTTLALPA